MLMEKVPREKRDPVGPQIHLARWTRPSVFRGRGTGVWKRWWARFNGRTLGLGHVWYRGVDAGSSRTENPWRPKGPGVPAGEVQVPECRDCGRQGRPRLWSQVQLEGRQLSSAHARLRAPQTRSVFSEEQLGVSLTRTGPF